MFPYLVSSDKNSFEGFIVEPKNKESIPSKNESIPIDRLLNSTESNGVSPSNALNLMIRNHELSRQSSRVNNGNVPKATNQQLLTERSQKEVKSKIKIPQNKPSSDQDLRKPQNNNPVQSIPIDYVEQQPNIQDNTLLHLSTDTKKQSNSISPKVKTKIPLTGRSTKPTSSKTDRNNINYRPKSKSNLSADELNRTTPLSRQKELSKSEINDYAQRILETVRSHGSDSKRTSRSERSSERNILQSNNNERVENTNLPPKPVLKSHQTTKEAAELSAGEQHKSVKDSKPRELKNNDSKTMITGIEVLPLKPIALEQRQSKVGLNTNLIPENNDSVQLGKTQSNFDSEILRTKTLESKVTETNTLGRSNLLTTKSHENNEEPAHNDVIHSNSKSEIVHRNKNQEIPKRIPDEGKLHANQPTAHAPPSVNDQDQFDRMSSTSRNLRASGTMSSNGLNHVQMLSNEKRVNKSQSNIQQANTKSNSNVTNILIPNILDMRRPMRFSNKDLNREAVAQNKDLNQESVAQNSANKIGMEEDNPMKSSVRIIL